LDIQQTIEAHIKEINPKLIQRYGWKIAVDGITVYASMKSLKDNEEYTLQIYCEGYPAQNPKIGFVNPETKASEPTACPLIHSGDGIPSIGPGNICMRPRSGTWTIGEIIHRFQTYLNCDRYGGRRRS